MIILFILDLSKPTEHLAINYFRISDTSKSLLDLEEVDGFIPSIYKVCAKTATGVFNNTLNTIKTALPATDEEVITYGIEKWEFEKIEEKVSLKSIKLNE